MSLTSDQNDEWPVFDNDKLRRLRRNTDYFYIVQNGYKSALYDEKFPIRMSGPVKRHTRWGMRVDPTMGIADLITMEPDTRSNWVDWCTEPIDYDNIG